MTRTATNPLQPRDRAPLGRDRNGFSRLLEPYRRELIAYCYRLTGSLSEAEDMTQEAFLRAFKARETFEGRATPRAWLYKIAHNLCVNHVQRRPPPWQSLDEQGAALLPAEGGDAEQVSLSREDVRLGFVALVQSLPPKQRAALVLRDVLGWSAEDAARILETTVPAVKNALARARETLKKRAGDPDVVYDTAASDPAAQETIAQWADAFEKGNTARMVALLTDTTKKARPELPASDQSRAQVAAGHTQSKLKKYETHVKETDQERDTHGKQQSQR